MQIHICIYRMIINNNEKRRFPVCQIDKPTVVKTNLKKVVQHTEYIRQVINPRPQAPQRQSVAKPGTSL